MSEREPSDYYGEVHQLLADLHIRSALIGGVAANAYRAQERMTTDVDFLVDRLDGIEEAYASTGHDTKTMADLGEAPHVLFVRGHGIKVDFLLAQTEYQQEALARSAARGRLTAEDVIVHKLLAWRRRDQQDIESILSTGRELDEPYIERWAAAWEVSERWAEAQTWR